MNILRLFNEDLVWLIQPMKAGTEPRPIGLSENTATLSYTQLH